MELKYKTKKELIEMINEANTHINAIEGVISNFQNNLQTLPTNFISKTPIQKRTSEYFVGQKVHSEKFKQGTIVSIDANTIENYPITVIFDTYIGVFSYTAEGFYLTKEHQEYKRYAQHKLKPIIAKGLK